MNDRISGVWILWHYILPLMSRSVPTSIALFTITITISSLAMLYEAGIQGAQSTGGLTSHRVKKS